MGWLVVTGIVVLALVALSMFALHRPSVVWGAAVRAGPGVSVADVEPHCPHCRSVVPAYSNRCPVCREEFDWASAPDDQSPLCVHCLTPAQDDVVRDRRRALGEEKAAARVAKAT